MSNTDNGGAAFATQHTVADANDPCFKFGQPGMTLRDYLAAKAMQGWFASWNGPNPTEDGFERTAHLAYDMADAMLRERGAA
jgi:hypothetical protein